MSKKRHTAEQTISKLREAEVFLSQGQSVPEACKKIEISEQTYYRWRKEYGGLRLDQAKRLKELERENRELRRANEILRKASAFFAQAVLDRRPK